MKVRDISIGHDIVIGKDGASKPVKHMKNGVECLNKPVKKYDTGGTVTTQPSFVPPQKQTTFNKGGCVKKAAKSLEKHGRNGDTMLVHLKPEHAKLLKRMGGSGTRNPKTGAKEYFWDDLLNAFAMGNGVQNTGRDAQGNQTYATTNMYDNSNKVNDQRAANQAANPLGLNVEQTKDVRGREAMQNAYNEELAKGYGQSGQSTPAQNNGQPQVQSQPQTSAVPRNTIQAPISAQSQPIAARKTGGRVLRRATGGNVPPKPATPTMNINYNLKKGGRCSFRRSNRDNY